MRLNPRFSRIYVDTGVPLRFTRQFTRPVVILSLSFASLVSWAARTSAQGSDAGISASDADEDAGVALHGLTPPVLVDSAPAEYPSGVAAETTAPPVALRLTLDTDGHVTELEVVESGGAAFDEAARATAMRYRFSPALRDRVPIVARVVVRVPFARPQTPPLPAAGQAPPAASGGSEEVVVQGRQSEGVRLAESAEAVMVQDLERSRRETASMGEVLSRLPGVSVRRSGGLGATERITLNGLSDSHVATFIDTVPSDFAYSTAELGSFPVSLGDRVEVYKGVVPVRFGADALGGAINIVTDQHYENRLGASAEVGSFGTRRFSLGGSYRHDPSGFVATLLGFHDYADNDYEVDVTIPDARGRSSPARVPRFHDAYSAYGVAAEIGVVDQPWATRLMLQGYVAGSSKELQHNVVMSTPYGEAEETGAAKGATARYEVDVSPRLKLQAIAGYSYRTTEFIDTAAWVYNWRGERTRRRDTPGETGPDPLDQLTWFHSALVRASLVYSIAPAHVITLTTAPTYVSQSGDDRLEDRPQRDELAALNQRLTTVTGLEYTANLIPMPHATDPNSTDEADYRLQNSVFAKHYLYQLWLDQFELGNVRRERTRDSSWFGIGDGVRYRFTDALMVKASYEYAVRLPTPEEVFGDGALTVPNHALEPEVSHNLNLGPSFEVNHTALGDLHVEVTGFLRDTDNQIQPLSNERLYKYENVYSARAFGLDASLGWTSPERYASIDGSVSFQDFRNTSDRGDFAPYEGDRMPNKPSLYASWAARGHLEHGRAHQLEPFYNGRFVGEFLRGWESRGTRRYKYAVASQVVHGLGVSYLFSSRSLDYSVTFEVQNLTDERLFDYFGVQRPGRSVSLKLTGELH